MAVWHERDKQDFNFQKHIFGKSFHTLHPRTQGGRGTDHKRK
jgi:hypothetical protein